MPDWTREVARRLEALSLRPERAAEVGEEIAQHLDDLYAELRAGGMPHEEAVRVALSELDARGGIVEQLGAVERRIDPDAVAGVKRPGEPLGNLWRDVRYATRLLTRNRIFSAVVIVTLALGIGLNTAVFSAVHALLFRPLPRVQEPDRLVQLYRGYPSLEYGSNSIPHFRDVRDRSGDVFDGVAVWRFVPVHVSAGGRTARVMGQMVSAEFFRVLGAPLVLGRGFLPEEDVAPGAHAVTVIGHGTWQTMFGGDPSVIGRSVVLNGRAYEIVGVAGAGFRGPIAVVEPALWVPLMQLDHFMPGSLDSFDARGNSFLLAFARLRDGVTVQQARARMDALQAELRAEHPGSYDEHSTIRLVPQAEAGMNPQWQGAQRALSAVLLGVVGVLLLIACVNVANLMLTRARARSREMAVRLSIGARRGQLVRQLLVESLLLALVAGAVSLLLARAVVGALNNVRLPFDVPLSLDLRLDPAVLLFTLVLSLLTGMVFGLVPALQATSPALMPTLKGDAPRGPRARASRALVVTQVALSLVLLIAAGLFVRSLAAAVRIDKGFNEANLLLATVDPGLQGYDRARAETFQATLAERLRAHPDVRAVAFAEMVPLGLGNQQRGVSVPGHEPAQGENMSVDYNIVTPGYFQAMGIPLLRGRAFSDRDDANAPGVIVINQRFADRFWPGEDPIGRTVIVSGREHTVIGVVPTGRYNRLGEAPLPFYYLAQAQWWNWQMTVHVRTAGDPALFAPTLRAEVRALDPDLPLADVRTMTQSLGIALLPARLGGIALAAFGLLGLVLAAVGIYGVIAYNVAQRAREIGIRMAVGAAQPQVVGALMRQGLVLVALGAALGLAGGWGVWWLVRGMLHGASSPDLLTFTAVPTLLAVVAALAIWIPARRAAGVDPVVALRME